MSEKFCLKVRHDKNHYRYFVAAIDPTRWEYTSLVKIPYVTNEALNQFKKFRRWIIDNQCGKQINPNRFVFSEQDFVYFMLVYGEFVEK